jgi:hypothetical protein
MIRLELPEQMMAVIASALGNHPYREAAPVIAEVQRQINVQQRTQAMPPMGNGRNQEEEVDSAANEGS